MSTRKTKDDVKGMFVRLCRMMGKNISSTEVGGWSLDYQSEYGGFVIEQLENQSGGVSHPLREKRRSCVEMYWSMYMCICAIDIMCDNWREILKEEKGESK